MGEDPRKHRWLRKRSAKEGDVTGRAAVVGNWGSASPGDLRGTVENTTQKCPSERLESWGV